MRVLRTIDNCKDCCCHCYSCWENVGVGIGGGRRLQKPRKVNAVGIKSECLVSEQSSLEARIVGLRGESSCGCWPGRFYETPLVRGRLHGVTDIFNASFFSFVSVYSRLNCDRVGRKVYHICFMQNTKQQFTNNSESGHGIDVNCLHETWGSHKGVA